MEADPVDIKPSKTSRLDLRVTEDERRVIAQRAATAGVKVSEYLRRSALGSPGVNTSESLASSILSKPERAQLASIANNLNQLTRYAHVGELDLATINNLVGYLKQLLA